MNRRETFTAPLALAALAAAPSFAGASSESEILRLYAEWKALDKIANGDVSEAAFTAAYAAMTAIEDRIALIPATTAAEIAAKVIMVGAGTDMNDSSKQSLALWAELRALVGEVA